MVLYEKETNLSAACWANNKLCITHCINLSLTQTQMVNWLVSKILYNNSLKKCDNFKDKIKNIIKG